MAVTGNRHLDRISQACVFFKEISYCRECGHYQACVYYKEMTYITKKRLLLSMYILWRIDWLSNMCLLYRIYTCNYLVLFNT